MGISKEDSGYVAAMEKQPNCEVGQVNNWLSLFMAKDSGYVAHAR